MLSRDNLRIVKQMEDAGLKVVSIDERGKLCYSTEDKSIDVCDDCVHFKLEPDPSPYDWFRDGDKRAVCLKLGVVIAGSLEQPSEWINISKPLFCPKLRQNLSEEEQKKASVMLANAKKALKA